eukprot:4122936-Alexandrium_andersonii.AAC.1
MRAARASLPNGAERTTRAVSSAYSMSKKGTTGVRIKSLLDRTTISASLIMAESTTMNREGESAQPWRMPADCARREET